MQNKIGIIGLGNMGSAVTRRLLAKDQTLVVYDLDPEAITRMVEFGATSASSARALAEQVDIIITILPNGPHVEAAARGSDGILANPKSNLIWLEMSTIDPNITRQLADQAAKHQVLLMDVAIGKLPMHALKGELLLMAGGDNEQLQQISSLLAFLGEWVHCGPTGAGVSMKLINNQLAGVTFAATCEALLLGRKAGLSFDTMTQVLSRTAANTAHLQGSMAQRVLPRMFEPGFRFDLMVKDAGLTLSMAEQLESPQLLGALVQQLRTMGLNQILQAQDTSAFVQIFEQLAGTQLDEG